MDTIILYSTGCPLCRHLENQLKAKNINYSHNGNIDEMLSKGIQSLPQLEVNGKLMLYKDALDWVKQQ